MAVVNGAQGIQYYAAAPMYSGVPAVYVPGQVRQYQLELTYFLGQSDLHYFVSIYSDEHRWLRDPSRQ